MALLEWNTNTSGRYISGVSHGVFYGDDGVPIPWNGLISVSEKFQTNEPTPVYNSLGQKYDLHGNVAEKRHSIVCYTYPEEMDDYLGTEYVEEFGFAVDERPPRKFNMVYRSECDGYYELHVLLGQIATFGDKTHATDTSAPGISNITMNLQGVPHEVFGSSHLIFDSRNPITASAERILFGTRNTDGDFNDFLNAEVQWIPQAINYAPTIEPDYDNRVWLGRENLISNSVAPLFSNPSTSVRWEETDLETQYGNPVVRFTKDLESGMPGFPMGRVYPEVGDTVTTWVDYKITNGAVTPHIRVLRGPGDLTWGTIDLPNGLTRYYRISEKFTEDDIAAEPYVQIYAMSSEVGASFELHDFKAEIGYGDTPWTPASIIQESGYNPPTNPYPPNYVPGIKNASKWNSTNVVPYWDEVTERLALYSKSPEEWTQSKLSIPLDVSTPVDLKTSADINFGGMVDEVVGENLLYGYRIDVGHPTIYSTNTPITNSAYGTANIIGDLPDHGELVTISFRMDVPAGRTQITIYNSGGNVRVGGVDVNNDGYYTLTVPWRAVGGVNDYVRIFSASTTAEYNSFPGDSTLYWIKLEYGSTATAWSPAPSNALHRRIIGTREPQVLSEQARNIIGSQTVTLNSTVHDTPHVDIYHNGPVGSDDVRVNNLFVTLQNYHGEFFDGNTVPKTRGERYRRVESTAGYYTVYEHLQFRTQSEIELRTIGTDLYELTGPETHLSIDGDQFTFIGPQATSLGDDTFEIDDTILGF